MSFNGKTTIITGSSRGIGKAIALRLAKEGAHIIVVAKSVEENPKLGGTIFSAAKEIEEGGGKAMQEELDQFQKNDIWKLVELPKDKKAIGATWVFCNKLDENGKL